MARVLAAADIGSNTVHLLVASVTPRKIRRLVNASEWLSLGQVVSHEQIIPSDLAATLIATVEQYVALSQKHDAEQIWIFATEAMRRASNHDAILRSIKRETGITVQIITPQQEAELGVKGALIELGPENPATVIEAGGGSVQIANWDGIQIVNSVSLRLGTGVMLDRSHLMQPAGPEELSLLNEMIEHELSQLEGLALQSRVVACGGVARGIWRALHSDGEPVVQLPELDFLAWSSRQLSQETIEKRFRVKPSRATTLLPGSILFAKLLRHLGANAMTVSLHGVREGAILTMLEHNGER